VNDKASVQYPRLEDLHRFYESAFDSSVEAGLRLARICEEQGEEKVADLLHMLEGAVYPDNSQAMEGATFKALAYVAHLYGLSHEERQKWYIVGQELPLSQAHVSYITKNVLARNKILSDLEEMVKERG
jgi:hypothetical protein